MDRISAILFPVLLIVVIMVIVKGLLVPLDTPVEKTYSGSPFAYGFTNGYATGEIICALIFGTVILNTLKAKGVSPSKMSFNMVSIGIIGIAMLACTHFAHMVIGSTSATSFPDLTYTALYTAVVFAEYGEIGGHLFTLALFLAALTTAVGMTSGCAEFFVEVSNGHFSYKQFAIAILVLSTLVGCLGLSNILTLLGPILDCVYPPTIVIVVYCAFVHQFEQPYLLHGAKLAVYCSFIFGVLDMIWKYFVKYGIFKNICMLYEMIPLASISLAWIPWTILTFLVGIILALSFGKKFYMKL